MYHTSKKSTIKSMLLAIAGLMIFMPTEANAQSEPYIGQIGVFGFNFCPRGWTPAAGQILSIAQNTALFSLYGTQYGGDGRTTFGLPDLRGRAVVSQGQAPGLSNYRIGSKFGAEVITLNTQQMPQHNHPGNAAGTSAATATMTGTATATVTATQAKISQTRGSAAGLGERNNGTADGTISAPDVTVSLDNLAISSIDIDNLAVTTHNVGGSQAHENRTPILTMQACVALVGIFPSRN